MHRLTPRDQATLLDYGVRTVVDLRTTAETETKPNVFAGSSHVSYLHQNVLGDDALPKDDTLSEGELVETGVPADRFRTIYTRWLDLRQPQFRETLATLAEPTARPAIYQCASGKDRTGVITALLLGIAGVPRATIAEDYALSARFLLQHNPDGLEPPGRESVTTWQQYQDESCPPEGMLKVLEHLDENYGGVKGYVRAIGLSDEQVQRLRNALVE